MALINRRTLPESFPAFITAFAVALRAHDHWIVGFFQNIAPIRKDVVPGFPLHGCSDHYLRDVAIQFFSLVHTLADCYTRIHFI